MNQEIHAEEEKVAQGLDEENHAEEEKVTQGVDKDAWVDCMRQRILVAGSDGPFHEEHLIYRVHSRLRKVNVSCYEPIGTSIGPYHHGKKHLLHMETHKKRYFKHLLGRNKDVTLEDLVKMMKKREKRVRECYPDEINEIKLHKSDAFIEMMLLDACFIVELLLRYGLRSCDDDLFVGPPWRLGLLKYRDLLLLENQLPFFLLQKIFKTVMPNEDRFAFVKLSLNFLQNSMQTLIVIDPLMAPESVHHLLHLWHTHLIRIPAQQLQEHLIGITAEQLQDSKILNLAQCFGMCNCCKETTQEPQELPWMPSVTQLEEAGVKFEASSNKNLLDIKFCNGVMKIPKIFIHLDTETQLRNLLAFEQCCLPPYQYYLSPYVFFLDFLINTSKDVDILDHKGILTHWLGEDEQVARLFNNNLEQGLYFHFGQSYLSDTMKRVNDYRSRKIHKWRASLVRDYFYSPWAVLSFVAAIVVLTLTFIQTLYSVQPK